LKILLVKPHPRLKTISALHRLILLEPLELGYVAAAVPQGHPVRVLDLRIAGNPQRTFLRELKNFAPDLVAFSGYTHEASRIVELAGMAKKLLPLVFVVVGGHHATVFPQDYNSDSFDAIVRGEGCAPFRSIVEARGSGASLKGIPNVLVPGEPFDESVINAIPCYPDLSQVPLPRRDLWDSRFYKCIWPVEKHPDFHTIFPQVALARSSFGCTMNCAFCVVPKLCGRKHIKRPPLDVAMEISAIKPDHVYFCDDETFLDEGHARGVAEAILSKGIKKHYFAWARSTTVNRSPDLFRFWREAGLDAVFLGFEATTDEELRRLDKHATVAENERALALLKEMGIAVQVGFMVRPEFTREDFDHLGRYVKTLPQAQVTFTVYTPSPGSAAWSIEKDKFVCDPFELHDCMHPLTPTSVSLPEFYRYFSALVSLGSRKNPLRAPGTKLRPGDIFRVCLAAWLYSRSLKRAYKDFETVKGSFHV